MSARLSHASAGPVPASGGQLQAPAEDLLQGALRAMADAVVIVDANGRIAFLNPIAAHLTGWRESESLGRPFADRIRFADAQGRSMELPDTGAASEVTLLLRRDGHAVLVESDSEPILDAAGRRRGAVVTFRNVTAARRLADELTWQATHDSLTGLSNRRAFESRLKRAVASAAQQGARHALLYIDLDRFKAVNDSGGHVAGDELLRQLAASLRRQLREHDTLARLGGDEFAVLLESCTPGQAGVVAAKLREAVAAHEFAWQGLRFRVGASIGGVVFADGARSPAELLRRADLLCYRAKAGGGDCVVAEG